MSGGARDELYAWIDRVNNRGVSGMFTDKTSDDKIKSEMFQLLYWMDAMKSEFGVETECFERPLEDPPDFWVIQDGKKKTVEVTEFVNGTFLAKVSDKRMKGEKYDAFHGQGFTECQWDQETFLNKLAGLIHKKQEIYLRRNINLDVLAIVTDEVWLYRSKVSEWLAQNYPRKQIRPFTEVYFVMGYDPNPPKGHPIFRLA